MKRLILLTFVAAAILRAQPTPTVLAAVSAARIENALKSADTGTVNVYVGCDPFNTAPIDGLIVMLTPANTNTGGSTLNWCTTGALPIQTGTGAALPGGAIQQNSSTVPSHALFVFSTAANAGAGAWELIGTGLSSGSGAGTTQTAGTGGVTANLLAARDLSNPSKYILPSSGGCGVGVAANTAAASSTFVLNSVAGSILTMVADNTVLSGDVLVGGVTTPGRVSDSGAMSSNGIPLTTCVVGTALGNASTGSTLQVLYAGAAASGTASGTGPCPATNTVANTLQCGSITGFLASPGRQLNVVTSGLANTSGAGAVSIVVNGTTYTLLANGPSLQTGQFFPGMPNFTVVLGATTAVVKEYIYAPGPSGLVTVDNTVSPNYWDVLTGPGQLCPTAGACSWTGLQSSPFSAVQTITATSTISVANNIQVSSSSAITMTSTPTLPATTDGTEVSILNTGTTAITFQDVSSLAGSLLSLGGANVTLAANQYLQLKYNVLKGVWVRGVAASGGIVLNSDCTSNDIPAMSSPTTGDCQPGGGSPLRWNGFALSNPGIQAVTPTAKTCSGSLALSESFNSYILVTVTAACTLTSSGGNIGEQTVFSICENATGGFAVTWPSAYHNAPTVTTTANTCTVAVFFTPDGTNFYRPN